MTNTQITVIAYLTVPPGMEQGVLDRFAPIVAQTRAEPGCLNYDFHRHPTDSHRFVFYENYVDQAAFDTHRRQPYIQAWTEWGRVNEGYFEVDVWTMLSEPTWDQRSGDAQLRTGAAQPAAAEHGALR